MSDGSARFRMTGEREDSGLWLIGLGPGDLKHMTSLAVEAARSSDRRYLEGYTAILPEDQEEGLAELVGSWERAMREAVERPDDIIMEAKSRRVSLMVVGDPMQATTHIDLKMRCEEEGVPFHVIPGISATSLAVSLSGLQSYRFGRQVTIPYQYGDYLPVSPLEMIVGNQMNNLHTLVLLDLDPTGMGVDAPIPMSPKQAFSTVMEMAERIGDREDDFSESLGSRIPEWDCILLSDIGTSDQRLVSGPFSEISNVAGGRIHCLIFPASFSGMEQAAFEHHKADT